MPRINPLFLELGDGISIKLGLPTIPSWNTKNRPKKPKSGTFGYNMQTSNLEYWDGKNWFAASMS